MCTEWLLLYGVWQLREGRWCQGSWEGERGANVRSSLLTSTQPRPSSEVPLPSWQAYFFGGSGTVTWLMLFSRWVTEAGAGCWGCFLRHPTEPGAFRTLPPNGAQLNRHCKLIKWDCFFFNPFSTLDVAIEVKENDWNLNWKELFTINSTVLYMYLACMSLKNHYYETRTNDITKKQKWYLFKELKK